MHSEGEWKYQQANLAIVYNVRQSENVTCGEGTSLLDRKRLFNTTQIFKHILFNKGKEKVLCFFSTYFYYYYYYRYNYLSGFLMGNCKSACYKTRVIKFPIVSHFEWVEAVKESMRQKKAANFQLLCCTNERRQSFQSNINSCQLCRQLSYEQEKVNFRDVW